jgi:hypothetical protein
MNENSKDAGRSLPITQEASTTEILYRTFNDVLIPLEKVRTQYFRNLNEQTFLTEIANGRIQLPITTLDTSRKAIKYIHIRHIASLIEARAAKAVDNILPYK